MMLKDKVAVIYGGGGAIGGAAARAFASEGAKVFVTGRSRAKVDAVAKEIAAGGGFAEAATVDALDEKAVDKHLKSVIDKAGRVDISFNAIGVPTEDVVGTPFLDVKVENFALPIMGYTTSYFLTARAAAKHMIPNKSGVIMTLSALPSRTGTDTNGGYGAAMAAKEALTRDLSLAFSRHGVRVVCLRPHGIPETETMKVLFERKLKPAGMSWDQFTGFLAGLTHPKRTMRLDEVGNMAAFMASDRASGMTGTTVNMTMGSLDD